MSPRGITQYHSGTKNASHQSSFLSCNKVGTRFIASIHQSSFLSCNKVGTRFIASMPCCMFFHHWVRWEKLVHFPPFFVSERYCACARVPKHAGKTKFPVCFCVSFVKRGV